MNIVVIIPAVNEAGNMRRLLDQIQRDIASDIIVVDNGSTDTTAVEARAAGAQVVSEPRRGYGYACAAGVAAATSAEILSFFGRDSSFYSPPIHDLTTPILEERAP